MSHTRTLPQLASVIMINEIMPRWDKYNLTETSIPASFVAGLVQLEFDKKITRKDLRELLDSYCELSKVNKLE